MTNKQINEYLERKDFRERLELIIGTLTLISETRAFQAIYGSIGFLIVMVVYKLAAKQGNHVILVAVLSGVLFFMTGALMVVMIAGCAWRAYLERLGGWK